MVRKHLFAAIFVAMIAHCDLAKAQFNTIVDKRNVSYEFLGKCPISVETAEINKDTVFIKGDISDLPVEVPNPRISPKINFNEPVRKKHLDFDRKFDAMPGLTLNSLLAEIRKCGIQHEKVVLAQAILETGWFTSSVCRNKNNLFGLTNPRTGQYYEFRHWKDSVKAYYTKVQYRYKGGNYLLWLDKIGYAEARTYVASLIRLMKQYFI